jgi:hypothetical protein
MTHNEAIAWAVRQRFERHGLHADKVLIDDDKILVLCPEMKRLSLMIILERVGETFTATHENGADVDFFNLYPMDARLFARLEATPDGREVAAA